MLRKMMFAGASCLALAACQTVGGVSSDTITQVQQIASTACLYLPTATTIANIIAANNPQLQTAQAIAAAICAAVAPTTARTFIATIPTVAGVQIDGKFLK